MRGLNSDSRACLVFLSPPRFALISLVFLKESLRRWRRRCSLAALAPTVIRPASKSYSSPLIPRSFSSASSDTPGIQPLEEARRTEQSLQGRVRRCSRERCSRERCSALAKVATCSAAPQEACARRHTPSPGVSRARCGACNPTTSCPSMHRDNRTQNAHQPWGHAGGSHTIS